MRITRVRLTNYRGIETLEVRLPRRGLCVLVGDNEIGKSSVVEAIDLLLDYPHDSRSQAVVATKPVHRDVGAEVEIDVESDDCAFTYRKRFHVAPRTELIVRAPQPENRTGREAHERVRALLRDRVDLDLWRALRVGQGSVGEQPGLAAAPSLARVLADDARRREQAHDDLLAAVRREAERYHTPGGERRRALVDEGADVTRRRREVERLEQAVAEVERDAERVLGLEDALRRACAAEDGAGRTAAALARERHEAEVHTQALVVAQQAVAAAEPPLRQCEQAIRLLREQDDLRRGAAAAAERAGDLEQAHVAAAQALDTAEQRHAAAVERRAAAQRDLVRAANAERLAAARRALADWHAVQAELAALPAIGAADVEQAARLAAAATQARARLSAQTADVEIHARSALTFTARAAQGDSEVIDLEAGASFRQRVDRELLLELADLTLSIRAGSHATELAAAAERADATLRLALDGLGVPSIAAAQEHLAARREGERARRELDGVLCRLLGVRTRAECDAALERLAVATGGDTSGDDGAPMPAVSAAQVEAEVAVALVDLRAAQRLELDARAAAQRVRAEAAQRGARLQAAAAALAALAETGTPTLGLDDAAAALARHADHLARTRHELAALRARSARALADIDADLARCQQEGRVAKAAAQRSRDELTALQAKLLLRGDEGLAEQLGRAESDLQRAAHAHAVHDRAATAAKTLLEALVGARDACVQTFHAPIKEGIERLGRAVFGASFRVQLDERLQVASRTLDGVTVAFKDLSLGAREQIAILLRLACAMAVAPRGGVPVWLDDALGQTDPGRLTGMGLALKLAGERCQVVLLTCSPQRSQWPGAHVVRLRPRRAGEFGHDAAS
ncbi:MAG: AAA family ATPase [Planctomycetota bacterium]